MSFGPGDAVTTYYVIIPYDDVELAGTRDVPHLGSLSTTSVASSAGP